MCQKCWVWCSLVARERERENSWMSVETMREGGDLLSHLLVQYHSSATLQRGTECTWKYNSTRRWTLRCTRVLSYLLVQCHSSAMLIALESTTRRQAGEHYNALSHILAQCHALSAFESTTTRRWTLQCTFTPLSKLPQRWVRSTNKYESVGLLVIEL